MRRTRTYNQPHKRTNQVILLATVFFSLFLAIALLHGVDTYVRTYGLRVFSGDDSIEMDAIDRSWNTIASESEKEQLQSYA